MKVKITMDSTADAPKELLESFDISFIPLIVNLGDDEFYDTENITSADILNYVEKTGKLPHTAARSAEDIKTFFKSFLDNGYDEIRDILDSDDFEESFRRPRRRISKESIRRNRRK